MNHLIGQKPVVATHCPVCGGFKLDFEEYCHACREWKHNADSLRQARARRKAFGDVI